MPTLFLLKKKALPSNFLTDFPVSLTGSFAILRPFTSNLILGAGYTQPNSDLLKRGKGRIALWEVTNCGCHRRQ